MTEKKQDPDYRHEKKLMELDGFSCIAGIDEAGRGPGAGPVVAASVHMPPELVKHFSGRLRDSKKMTEKQRNKMFVVVQTHCKYGVGMASSQEIDDINILEATKLAIKRSLDELGKSLDGNLMVDYALIDGNMSFGNLEVPYESLVKGDNRSLSISAASVIAKVTRDRLMNRLHEEFPVYGWNSNKGYLSKKHIEAIKEHGTTPHHRLSFKKVGH